MTAIEVADLHRSYTAKKGKFLRKKEHRVHALNGINLNVAPGTLFGLLGPNGAGKTTTVKILTTLLLPTSGTVRIQGVDALADPHEVRAHIGYALGGDRGFYDRLSARDNLRFFADLYQIPARDQKSRIDELLDLVDLEARQGDRIEGYSRGMKQRLHIARSMLHDPAVLFLDEPTNGLDPVAARNIRQTVKRLRDAGKTILLTTHYMFEAEELCDRLAVINNGKIVVEGTARELASAAQTGVVVRAELRGADSSVCTDLQAAPDVIDATLEPLDGREVLTVRLSIDSTEKAEQIIRNTLAEHDHVAILDISLREPTLEDSYVSLVSQSDKGEGE